MSTGVVSFDHRNLETVLQEQKKEVENFLTQMVKRKEITTFTLTILPDSFGEGLISFLFLYKKKILQAKFRVDFIAMRKDGVFSLRGILEGDFCEKIKQEKNFRVEAYTLELLCLDILRELKDTTLSIDVAKIGNLDIRVIQVFEASENQDHTKKSDVTIVVHVHFQNEKFVSSSAAHTIGLQVKSSPFGQQKHIKNFPGVPSIHMKEDNVLVERAILKKRLETIVKKVTMLRTVEFFQAIIFRQTEDTYLKVNKELSVIAGKLRKEIHK